MQKQSNNLLIGLPSCGLYVKLNRDKCANFIKCILHLIILITLNYLL